MIISDGIIGVGAQFTPGYWNNGILDWTSFFFTLIELFSLGLKLLIKFLSFYGQTMTAKSLKGVFGKHTNFSRGSAGSVVKTEIHGFFLMLF